MAYNSAYTGPQVDAGIAKANSAVQTDGSVPMTGALQMGGNKVTNLGAPGADTDAVRKQDLDAVAAEVDGILDGTTPAHLAPATETKIGGVIIGEGLSVEADGTVSAAGVTTFNGRTGAVIPGEDDYSAAMIKFTDGETFQQKYDAGELTGPQGEQGPKGDTGPAGADGAAATINGVNALALNATGGISGSQSGSTYTLDGRAFVQKTANLSGTDYTTIRARGIQLVSSAPGTLPNGCIAIVYS